jgi:hypothetical protein
MTREYRDAGYDDFLDALAEGEAHYLEGPDGDGFLPPREVHPRTGAELAERPLPDAGEVLTYTRVEVPTPQLADDAPYVLAVAQFGPVRLTGQVHSDDPDDVEVGMRVTADVGETVTSGERMVVFRPR